MNHCVDSLILTAWDELDQRVIDTAVRQWCTHLRVCAKLLQVRLVQVRTVPKSTVGNCCVKTFTRWMPLLMPNDQHKSTERY